MFIYNEKVWSHVFSLSAFDLRKSVLVGLSSALPLPDKKKCIRFKCNLWVCHIIFHLLYSVTRCMLRLFLFLYRAIPLIIFKDVCSSWVCVYLQLYMFCYNKTVLNKPLMMCSLCLWLFASEQMPLTSDSGRNIPFFYATGCQNRWSLRPMSRHFVSVSCSQNIPKMSAIC